MSSAGVYRVYLVEDSLAIRTVLTQRILDDSRFVVIGNADTARDAIDALTRDAPDIVVVDLQLKAGDRLRHSGAPAQVGTVAPQCGPSS